MLYIRTDACAAAYYTSFKWEKNSECFWRMLALTWWSWCWCFLLSFNCIRTFKHDSFIFFLCFLLKRFRYWYHVTTKSLSVLAWMHLKHIKPLRLMIKSPLIYHSKFSIFIRGSKSEKYFTLLMLINDSFWAVFSFSSVNNDRRVANIGTPTDFDMVILIFLFSIWYWHWLYVFSSIWQHIEALSSYM